MNCPLCRSTNIAEPDYKNNRYYLYCVDCACYKQFHAFNFREHEGIHYSLEEFLEKFPIVIKSYEYHPYTVEENYKDDELIIYRVFFPVIQNFGNCVIYRPEELGFKFNPLRPKPLLDKVEILITFA